MRFKRHEGSARDHFHVYADTDDPITQVTGVGGYTGEVFPCNGATVPDPVCADEHGRRCGMWHGYTGTVQLPKHPESNVWGFESRDAAVASIMGIRQLWADEIKRERVENGK